MRKIQLSNSIDDWMAEQSWFRETVETAIRESGWRLDASQTDLSRPFSQWRKWLSALYRREFNSEIRWCKYGTLNHNPDIARRLFAFLKNHLRTQISEQAWR